MRLTAGVRLVSRPAPDNVLRLDQAALPMVDHMQRTGIAIDRGAFQELATWLAQDMERLEGEIEQAVGRRVNPGSGDQVADLLFRELGLKLPSGRAPKLTKTGKRESTGRVELEPYLGQHPVVRLLFDHRERDKLKSTYAEGIPARAHRTDYGWRIHTNLKTTRVPTGRLSSSDPNLQNIPVRTELGKRIKNCFVARPGRVLISVDLSQIEMVMEAHLAQPPRMLEIFRRPKYLPDGRKNIAADIHRQTGTRIFHIPLEAVSENQRYRMKRTGFGIIYLITPAGLAVQLNGPDGYDPDNPHVWTDEEAGELIEGWYGEYPEVRARQEMQIQRARRYGMVWDISGRVRLVPEVRSAHRWIREAGERQANNHEVQGGAQVVMKVGMVEVWDVYQQLWASKLEGDPVMQIHDDVLSEVDKAEASWVGELIKQTMEGAVPLSVPVRAQIAVGERWGELVEARPLCPYLSPPRLTRPNPAIP